MTRAEKQQQSDVNVCLKAVKEICLTKVAF